MAEVDIFSWAFWRPKSIEDMRYLVLMVAGCLALLLATWRSWLAHKQTRLSEAGQNIDRYQKGAAMLGDARLSVRQAGILGLAELVDKDPRTYFAVVQPLLCSFVRDRSEEQRKDATSAVAETPQDKDGETTVEPMKITADCQTAATKISELHRAAGQWRIPLRWFDVRRFLPLWIVPKPWRAPLFIGTVDSIDLHGANLGWADLGDADLSMANLDMADLTGANLVTANLIAANLFGTKLSMVNLIGANLRGADLTHASLCNADLSEADLTAAIGVTLSQLHSARRVDQKWIDEVSSRDESGDAGW